MEGSLAAAFASRRGDAVAQLAGMMEAVGRGPAVLKLYISARSAPLQVFLLVLSACKQVVNTSWQICIGTVCQLAACVVCAE